MKRSGRDWMAVIAALCTWIAGDVVHGQEILYRATSLGGLPGCTNSSFAEDLNEAGQVAGSGSIEYCEIHAFFWDPRGGMVDLGDLPGGGDGSTGKAVNNHGHVAGTANSVNGNEAFLWTPEAGMVGLGDLPGNVFWSLGYGINDFDQVVGVTATEYYGRGVHEAFLWDPEMGMFGLGHLPAGDFNSWALDINNRMQVTGVSEGATRLLEAFIWDPVNKMRPLGDAPGIWPSIGYAINELGQVVGSAGTAAGRTEAFFWDPKMGIRVLGVLPGTYPASSARGINDHGVVVGLAFSGDIFNRRQEGFIWDAENGLRSLNDLLEARTPAEQREIVRALEINNAGQIIGDPHYVSADVLLTPFLLSDLNCDEQVDLADLAALRLLLDYPAVYEAIYRDCPGESAGDVNQDAAVDERDYWSLRGLLTREPKQDRLIFP